MLAGFDKFSEVMRNHNEQFVVIGGTACEAALGGSDVDLSDVSGLYIRNA